MGVRKTAGAFTGSAGVFVTKFSDYIKLAPSTDPATGRQFSRDGDDRPGQGANPAVGGGAGPPRPEAAIFPQTPPRRPLAAPGLS